VTDSPEDSEQGLEQAQGAASRQEPGDTTPPRSRSQPLSPNGNLLTRILVPTYLVMLIIVFTDVLLITWPMTHADESVVCFVDKDAAATGRNPFSAIDAIVHDLIQFCPDHDAIAIAGMMEANDIDDAAPDLSGAGPGADAADEAGAAGLTLPDPVPATGSPDKPGTTAGGEVRALSKFTDPRQANALFLAVLSAGMIGGAVYSLRAHTVHIALGNYLASWWQWNVTRPFLSGALAILFFFLVRAGFVENGQASALRPEGFIAIGGLVGLFTDQAWAKIRQIANATFAEADHGAGNEGEVPAATPPPAGG
jgi:hypothetical protein